MKFTKMHGLDRKQIMSMLNTHKSAIGKFNARKIGLFGSYAKNTQNKKSDIDILVAFGEKSFDNYMELKFFLEHLFNKRVDLVIEENLRKELSYIKREAEYVRIF